MGHMGSAQGVAAVQGLHWFELEFDLEFNLYVNILFVGLVV
jgi:hypothetical protein